MGVDAEDVNGDGLPDLIVTNFANEYNTLHLNLASGLFMDATPFLRARRRYHAVRRLGDCPGRLRQRRLARQLRRQRPRRRQSPASSGRITSTRSPHCSSSTCRASASAWRLATPGPYFETKHVGRGAAFGDIDNDGDIDIVVNHKDGTPALLRNDTKSDNHWIRLELQGTRSNRDAIGTRVEIEVGGRTIYRQRKGGYSLESSNDPRLLIGVGPATRGR